MWEYFEKRAKMTNEKHAKTDKASPTQETPEDQVDSSGTEKQREDAENRKDQPTGESDPKDSR